MGNTNHPGLRTGGGTGGELQWHIRWREEQPWDATTRSHVCRWHLPSLYRGPDLSAQPSSGRYSCGNFSLFRETLCLNIYGDNPSDLKHYVQVCIDWLNLVCFRWPLICDLNNMNGVAAFSFLSGMRYKRRGVDTDGHVANYVETEQLIHVHSHTLSFVQTRGSVPVFWSQAGYRYNPRPRLEKGQ